MADTESVSRDDLIVCTCGSREYTPRDAIDAALFRGELDSKWAEFLRCVESEKRADELDLDLDDDTIATAAEAFRYEHDLITAEETEAFLANRGLTLDDFTDYFTRHYCAGAITEKVPSEDIDYISASSELRQVFMAEAILSGELDRMTTELMRRLAVRCAENKVDSEALAAEERSFLDRNKIEPAQLPNWLERLGRDLEWLNEMVAMEAVYRRRCETVLVPQARQRVTCWTHSRAATDSNCAELSRKSNRKRTTRWSDCELSSGFLTGISPSSPASTPNDALVPNFGIMKVQDSEILRRTSVFRF